MARPTVAVTGASRGIGRSIALAFAREGAHVVLAARSRGALGAVADEVAVAGGTATIAPTDVANDASVRALAAIVDRVGPLDVLVNNAGLFRAAPLAETDLEGEWLEMLDVNLTGSFLPTYRLAPALLRAERPHLFFVLSVAALRGYPGNWGYGAAKWGARGLAEVARAELGPRVRVTAVFPGATDTDAWAGVTFPHDRTRMLRPGQVADAIVGAWRAETAPAEIVLETPPGAVG